MQKRPELLSPAGNFEKMKSAILYGADAVYLAGNDFGMRAAADNFTDEELVTAVAYAHERGVKVYITLNTMPHPDEYADLRKYLSFLKGVAPDAVICVDLGVISLVREMLPDVELHISTQASVVSAEAAIMWQKLGAKRIVLARELTFDEILKIRASVPDDLELEAFIHGSMCISYSGRCLLSQHYTNRDANRGRCAQPCRWNFEIYEEKRPDDVLALEQDKNGTFIMSSKDMCMIEHIPELVKSGITSFKISLEGLKLRAMRMRLAPRLLAGAYSPVLVVQELPKSPILLIHLARDAHIVLHADGRKVDEGRCHNTLKRQLEVFDHGKVGATVEPVLKQAHHTVSTLLARASGGEKTVGQPNAYVMRIFPMGKVRLVNGH